MKLTFIFELLLVFVLIAFAASAVIENTHGRNSKKSLNTRRRKKQKDSKEETTNNKYCNCTSVSCNCCRPFNLPLVTLKGPGCATLQYLDGDRLSITMSFAERVLANTTVSSKSPEPICIPLPGRFTKFCGRVYNIGRKEQNFNACLGLELRSAEEIEAAVRVSCFRFGPEGLKLEPPQPLPVIEDAEDSGIDEDSDDDEEYDYDDDDDDDIAYDDNDDDDDDDDDEEDQDDSSNSSGSGGNKKTKGKKKSEKNKSSTSPPVASVKPAKKRNPTKKPPRTTMAPVTAANSTEGEHTTLKPKPDSSEENDVFDDIGDAIGETLGDGPDDDSEESDEE